MAIFFWKLKLSSQMSSLHHIGLSAGSVSRTHICLVSTSNVGQSLQKVFVSEKF